MTDRHNADSDFQVTELSQTFDTIGEQYSALKNYLYGAGYLIIPGSGQFVFHQVYNLCKPKIPGVKIPNSFRYWREITSIHSINAFQSLVNTWIGEDWDGRKDMLPFVVPDTTKRKPIYGYVQSLIALREAREHQNATSLTESLIDPLPETPLNQPSINPDDPYNPAYQSEPGIDPSKAPRAFIPRSEWFTDEIRSLKIEDILTLYPRSERELISVAIGRALVGSSGTVTPSGLEIRHTYRMASMTYGDPGLGKSTFFSYLFNAVKTVGYKVETFADMGARFNLGSVATADIIYRDDMTSKGVKRFGESEATKIIVTGTDFLKVEDKGVDAINVKPRGVIFCNANEVNPRLIFGFDPGVADRLKVLSTYRKGELSKLKIGDSPSALPERHLPYLADKMGVPVETIMLWLCRLCVDKFLSLIKETNENELQKFVHYHTLRLRFPLHKQATAQVMAFFVLCFAAQASLLEIRTLSAWAEGDYIPAANLDWCSFCRNAAAIMLSEFGLIYLAFLKYDFEVHNSCDDLHPYLGARYLNPVSLHEANKELGHSAIPFDKMSEELFKRLTLNSGLPLSSDIVWINNSLDQILPTIADLLSKGRWMSATIDRVFSKADEASKYSPNMWAGLNFDTEVSGKLEKYYDQIRREVDSYYG